jgi:hypothetical protein
MKKTVAVTTLSLTLILACLSIAQSQVPRRTRICCAPSLLTDLTL